MHILHIVCLPRGERESQQLGLYFATNGQHLLQYTRCKVNGLAGVIASSERSTSEE